MDYLRYAGSGGRIDGIVSGFDTTTIIAKLSQARRVPITRLESCKQQEQTLLAAYQTLGATLLSLGSQAKQLQSSATYHQRQITNSQPALLTASASSGAATGTYQLVVSQLAQAHKIASGQTASATEALGLMGNILINGKAVLLDSTDSLTDLARKISRAGAGVSATVLTISKTDHRLVLTAGSVGSASAVDLVEANSSNILQQLGLVGGGSATKQAITDGVASDYLSSASGAVTSVLGLSQGPTGAIQVNGTAVAIDLGADSLQDIAARINSMVAGVTASVTQRTQGGTSSWRLELTGVGGAPALSDDGNVLQALGFLTKPVANQLQAAQDAELTVDGFAVRRSSNSADGVIPGVSIQLLKADPESTVTLTVSPSSQSAVSAVQSVVGRFNDIMETLRAGLAFDAEAGKGGRFFGEIALMNLQSSLAQQATSAVGTLRALGANPALSSIGISVDQYGKLTLNTQTLQSALETNPTAVERLLGTTVWADSTEVQYVTSATTTADSGPGGYAVSITQAATRPTAASAQLLGGITRTETLTFNGSYRVTLTAGASLEAAAQALNSLFQTSRLSLTASVQDGRLSVTHSRYGSAYSFTVASSLDAGEGGTGLGGAMAGQEATYRGADVAGTINGETASGYGQTLTGAGARTTGLTLRITSASAGDKGFVYVSKGLGSRLHDLTQRATDAVTGTLKTAESAVSDRISAIDREIERLDKQVDAYVAKLQLQFSAMEKTLGRMQNLGTWLSQQIDSLSNVYRRR